MAEARLIKELVAGGTVLTDGAWGTAFQQRGLQLGEMPDVWNLEHPDAVEDVARAYVEAGSRVILTNTFRANRLAFATHAQVHRIAEINRAGVEISKRAAADRALVFASIGPSGKQLITGDVTEEELARAFVEQAGAQAEGGADAIVIETMADLTAARLAIEAAKRTGLPVVACMVFDSGRNKDRTMMGVDPEQMATAFHTWGADVIGANCGNGVEEYVPICRRLAAATKLPVWIKPNAGIPTLIDGDVVYQTTAEEFASVLPTLVEAGAAFLGGCCGTDPAFIAAMKRTLSELSGHSRD
jgi:methionine synthase I (cobalamin-dependent)